MTKTNPDLNDTPHIVTVYGSNWCHSTKQARRHLEDLGVPYRYVDIEADSKSAQWVREQTSGDSGKPTLRIGSTVISTPSERNLDKALRRNGFVI